jgi:hypothetical protein
MPCIDALPVVGSENGVALLGSKIQPQSAIPRRKWGYIRIDREPDGQVTVEQGRPALTTLSRNLQWPGPAPPANADLSLRRPTVPQHPPKRKSRPAPAAGSTGGLRTMVATERKMGEPKHGWYGTCAYTSRE